MARILIKFVQNTAKWEAWGDPGQALMKLANEKGEIFGYCGGQLACTTCRVYISKNYERLLPLPSDLELDTLCELPNNAYFPEKDFIKRMSCQLKCEKRLHGLTVHIPSLYF